MIDGDSVLQVHDFTRGKGGGQVSTARGNHFIIMPKASKGATAQALRCAARVLLQGTAACSLGRRFR